MPKTVGAEYGQNPQRRRAFIRRENVWRKEETAYRGKEFICYGTKPFCLCVYPEKRGFFVYTGKTPFGRTIYKEVKKVAKVELKQPIVEEISASIKDAQSVVLVDYRGLTVEQDTRLRKELREAGITYKVYKNTMMNFAFKGTDFEALVPYLEGPSAVAISSSDATAPARVLCKFAKEAPKLEVKGGMVEGIAYDATGIADIAKIPSREELLSKLFGSMQAPIANFARVMNQLAEKGGASAAEASSEAAEPAAEAPAEEAPAAE